MPTESVSSATYFRTFGALLGLLALTVGANFVNLGPFNVVVVMAISIAKAALIMLFFMEVRYSHRIVWLFACASLLWLVMLLTITLADYVARPWSGQDWTQGLRGSNKVQFVGSAHPPGK